MNNQNPYTARREAAERAIAKQMRFWRIKRMLNIPCLIGRMVTWIKRPRCLECGKWFNPLKLQPWSDTELCLECAGRSLTAQAYRRLDLWFSLTGREN